MSIARHIPNDIKRVSKSVGYALWLDNADDWFNLPVILRARLHARQRAALAFMALKSLDREGALLTAEAALSDGSGQPIVPLFNHMDEAAFWADIASDGELKAYALACFTRLSPGNQAAFLDYVQGKAAA